MKHVIIYPFFMVSLFAADATTSVREAAGVWAQAVLERNGAVLEQVLADGLEFSRAGSLSSQSKVEYINAIVNREGSYESVVPRDLMIQIHGHTAVVSGYVDEKARGGRSSTARVLQFYVENNSQWQLASSLATALGGPDGGQQGVTGDPAGRVRDAAVAWTRAVVSRDRAALEALLTDDLNFALTDGRTALTKNEYIALTTARQSAYETFALTGDVTIHVHGLGAVLSAYVDTKPSGGPATMVRFMQLYWKENGQWQLASSAATEVRARGRNGDGPAEDVSEAVRDTAVAWTQALVAKDHISLDRLVADDLIFGHSSGRPPRTKSEFLAYADGSDYEALPLRDIHIRIYGQMAVISALLDTKHIGRPTNPVKTLQVFRQVNDQWQLAAFQSARLEDPRPGERISGRAPSAEVEAVEEAATGWTTAVIQKNKDGLERLLSPDLIFVHSNGSTIQNRAQYITASERARYEALPLSDVQTRVYNGTAVLTAYIDTKNIGRDSFRVRSVQIFVKNNGQWQLAAFQSTRLSSGPRR